MFSPIPDCIEGKLCSPEIIFVVQEYFDSEIYYLWWNMEYGGAGHNHNHKLRYHEGLYYVDMRF
jgi:hypothetical protein